MNTMQPSLKAAYGACKIPDIIHRLTVLNNDFIRHGLDMGFIGFRLLDDYEPHFITPPDLIPFADTGGDGIHFGFLTDFGAVHRLEDAPVVCVTPTNDPPIRLIARNIVDFLDLMVSVPYTENLEAWWSCEQEEEQRKADGVFESGFPEEVRQQRAEIYGRLKTELGAKPRPILPYIRETLRLRKQQISISTLDGLGVTGADAAEERYAFDNRRSEDETELDRMRTYLSAVSSREARLAFIRDVMYWYVIDRNAPSPVSFLLKEIMVSLGLKDEAARMFDI